MIQLGVRLRGSCQVLRAAFVAEKAPGKSGDGSAAMRKNVADVGSARGRSAGNETDDRSAHIGVVLNGCLVNTRQEISATATRCRAVRIDDGLAAVEFIENRLERFVAEPLISPVAQQANAFGFERVEGVFDLAQTGVHIRKGQD